MTGDGICYQRKAREHEQVSREEGDQAASSHHPSLTYPERNADRNPERESQGFSGQSTPGEDRAAQAGTSPLGAGVRVTRQSESLQGTDIPGRCNRHLQRNKLILCLESATEATEKGNRLLGRIWRDWSSHSMLAGMQMVQMKNRPAASQMLKWSNCNSMVIPFLSLCPHKNLHTSVHGSIILPKSRNKPNAHELMNGLSKKTGGISIQRAIICHKKE